MKVKDMMTTKVISFQKGMPVASALAKMSSAKIHQAPVVEGEKIIGMLELKHTVVKRIDPYNAKVENLAANVAPISPEEDFQDAVEYLLKSGKRALPVVSGNKIVGVISEADIMKKNPNKINDKKASEIMSKCECVGIKDNIGKVSKLMVNHNVSRVPVIDKGHIVGVVDTLGLVKIILGTEPMKGRGGQRKERGAKEKVGITETSVKNAMRDVKKISPEVSIGEVSKVLASDEEVFIEDGGYFYVITPKDIIETFVKKEERGVYIQLANLGEEDDFVVDKLYQVCTEFVQKIGKMMPEINSFIVHYDRHKAAGAKTQYAVRTRFFTPIGLMVSHASGWDITTATQEAIGKLEREVMKKYERKKKY